MKGIFKIENKSNGKVYIGMSKDIEKRYTEIVKHKGSKNLLYIEESILEEGVDNFELSVLEEVENDFDLTEKRTFWINKYDSDVKGYNRMKHIKATDFKMPFGKYMDVLFINIPISYFKWLSSQEWMNEKTKLLRRLKLFFHLVKEGDIKYKLK